MGRRGARSLWHGPALAGHRLDTFDQSAITRLVELHAEAIEERPAAELTQGRADDSRAPLR